MNDLRKAAEQALEALEFLVKNELSKKGSVKAHFRLVTIPALRQALAQPVDAVNMSQERVDETAKSRHIEREACLKLCQDVMLELHDAPRKLGAKRCIEAILDRKKQYEGLLSSPIKDLGLHKRSINCLRADCIKTIGELCNKYEYEIKKIPNLGKVSFNDIVEALAKHGLSLKEKKT